MKQMKQMKQIGTFLFVTSLKQKGMSLFVSLFVSQFVSHFIKFNISSLLIAPTLFVISFPFSITTKVGI